MHTRWTLAECLVLLAMLAALGGLAALYGHWAYGNWKCGMPGVRCRIEVK